jgi:hypothetical protein
MKRFRASRDHEASPNAAISEPGPRREVQRLSARMRETARLKWAVLEEGEKTSEKRK